MYICYLDESGTAETTGNTSHFILLGLAIPAETWKLKDLQVTGVKAKYSLQEVEIHTAWMLKSYPEQIRGRDFEKLSYSERRKAVLGVRSLNLGRAKSRASTNRLLREYRKTEPYVHLTLRHRRAAVLELANLVGSWGDARIFADAHDKDRVGDRDTFRIAFEQVVTRFNTFLRKTGGPSGLIVEDDNQTVSKRLTTLMRRFHDEGTLWSEIDKIVETPLFVDSQLTSMVQLADLCAFATRRFFEKGETELFDTIYDRFDRSGQSLVGLRHFTGATACECRVCVDHGRR